MKGSALNQPCDNGSLALTPELVYRAIGRHCLGTARAEGMSSKGNLSEDAKLHAKDAAQRARPWMERLARLGYATEGAVYALIGLLAAGAAFGTGGRATGQRGTFEIVAGSPFGGVLLGLIAVGCSSLGTFSTRFTELVGVPPSVYRRQAARATAGMPSCVAKQVTRPIRNREAPSPSRS